MLTAVRTRNAPTPLILLYYLSFSEMSTCRNLSQVEDDSYQIINTPGFRRWPCPRKEQEVKDEMWKFALWVQVCLYFQKPTSQPISSSQCVHLQRTLHILLRNKPLNHVGLLHKWWMNREKWGHLIFFKKRTDSGLNAESSLGSKIHYFVTECSEPFCFMFLQCIQVQFYNRHASKHSYLKCN